MTCTEIRSTGLPNFNNLNLKLMKWSKMIFVPFQIHSDVNRGHRLFCQHVAGVVWNMNVCVCRRLDPPVFTSSCFNWAAVVN